MLNLFTIQILTFYASSVTSDNVYKLLTSEETKQNYTFCPTCKTEFQKAAATCMACSSFIVTVSKNEESVISRLTTDRIWQYPFLTTVAYGNGSRHCFVDNKKHCNDNQTSVKLRNPLFMASDPCFVSTKSDFSKFDQIKCTSHVNFVCMPQENKTETAESCSVAEYCKGILKLSLQ